MRERGKTIKNSISETISLSFFLNYFFYKLGFVAHYNCKNILGGNNYVSKILFTH